MKRIQKRRQRDRRPIGSEPLRDLENNRATRGVTRQKIGTIRRILHGVAVSGDGFLFEVFAKGEVKLNRPEVMGQVEIWESQKFGSLALSSATGIHSLAKARYMTDECKQGIEKDLLLGVPANRNQAGRIQGAV
jgi:hypothetical protein